jgi:hypothetical protein
MLMLIMGLDSQYINKITSNSTSFCTSLQPKRIMHLLDLKLTKHYIISSKEIFYIWKYPKVDPTINNYYLEVYKDSNHYYQRKLWNYNLTNC